jgi:deoxyadenosine/deoxycytidine kinase
MHIAIIGNIGAGKTTLTRMLGEYYQWEVLYEAVEGNPYLADFYHDMERWAFNLQIFFLITRFSQAQKISEMKGVTVIQDRTIYEDAFIFARNLFESGTMSERDYQSYLLLFQSIEKSVQPPDLLIYLKADLPKLLRQIQIRKRDFEADIPLEYLQNLNRYYNEFATTYDQGRLIEIDVNNLDYATNPEDFRKITSLLDKELTDIGIF